jgi:hypothetical protein
LSGGSVPESFDFPIRPFDFSLYQQLDLAESLSTAIHLDSLAGLLFVALKYSSTEGRYLDVKSPHIILSFNALTHRELGTFCENFRRVMTSHNQS